MINSYNDKEFQDFLKRKKCSLCKEKATAMIYSKLVCARCFNKLKR